MARVEYIGRNPVEFGRGIAKGLVWEGPGDILDIADEIAAKLEEWHGDTFRIVPDMPDAPGTPGAPSRKDPERNGTALVTSYEIPSGGKVAPATRAGVFALRGHMTSTLGLKLKKKMSKSELLTALEEVLQAKAKAKTEAGEGTAPQDA